MVRISILTVLLFSFMGNVNSQEIDLSADGKKEIDPKSQYKVTSYPGYDPLPAKTMTGAEFLRSKAEISNRPGSVLIEYGKVKK